MKAYWLETSLIWNEFDFVLTIGNLLTDAIIEYHVDKRQSEDQWALSAIALLSGGSIRASVQPGMCELEYWHNDKYYKTIEDHVNNSPYNLWLSYFILCW